MRINIIAMAGEGRRFLNQKFSYPKPLILIKNKPMFYYAVRSLAKSDKYIFICQKSLMSYKIFNKFIRKFKNNKIIPLNRKTSGQASTCKQALKHVNNDDIITFGACDYSFKLNTKKYNKLVTENDVVVVVKKTKKYNIKNFQEFGWVRIGKNNNINDVKCKKKVSKRPKKDYIVVGAFTFKNLKIFMKCFNAMKKNRDKINNEYYLDQLIHYSIKFNYKTKYILAQNFRGFGSPKELIK